MAIRLNRVLVQGALTPYKVVQRFVWTRVGPDVTLDIGYFDMVELHQASEGVAASAEKDQAVNFYVTDRLVLSGTGIQSFIESAEQLKAHLRDAGITFPEGAETGEDTGDA